MCTAFDDSDKGVSFRNRCSEWRSREFCIRVNLLYHGRSGYNEPWGIRINEIIFVIVE